MGTTNREKKQVAKKVKRRKRLDNLRNRGYLKMRHLLKRAKRAAKAEASFMDKYNALKEQQEKSKAITKENKVVKFIKNLFRGKQRGSV